MPPHSAARPPSRRSTAALLWLAVALAVLSSCTTGVASSATGSETSPGLSAAGAGLCEALAALPDRSAAERAFTNDAHAPLHSLAADARLDRALSAGILEAMQLVEEDFSRSVDADALSHDLGVLRSSAVTALDALGEGVPTCGA